MNHRLANCLITSLFFLIVFLHLSDAQSSSTQMLPPVTEATKTSNTPTPCLTTDGVQVLTWDGQNIISCATGVTASGGNLSISGNITASGNIIVLATATVGTSCSVVGAIAQDGTGKILSCQHGTSGNTWRQGTSTTTSPSGTVCGSSVMDVPKYGNAWHLVASCQGYDPNVSCPSGYSNGMLFEAYSNGVQTCFAN